MPCLKIMTNVPKEKIPKDFVTRIIPVLSRTVKKDENTFLCVILPDLQMHIFGDSSSPGAIATLESIGNLGSEENKIIMRELADFVEMEIGVAPKRFFLSFYDLQAHNIGVSGTTVEHLTGK